MTKGFERQMNGSVVELTQMLLSYISAHLYVVFLLKDERALEYLYFGSVCMCASGGLCLPLYLIV